ncbi:FAD-binding protein [Streptomyces sp. WAC02707]|uniref:FAD-binding protein n=1 Tax=Streptomyces sp. WAC02707 TaxID=2487417 RepID=UPI00269A2F26
MSEAENHVPWGQRRTLQVAAGAVTAAGVSLAAASAPSTAGDVIVVGGGLAGLVATSELAAAERRVIPVDQEPEVSFGGQAFWSLGGLFMLDSHEHLLRGNKDSVEFARQNWYGTAGWDRWVDDRLG